jgi:hypothetical protein
VSLVAGICANVFILIDYIFDYCLRRIGFYSNSPVQKDSGVPSVYVPLRESIAYLLVPDVLILFWLIPSEHYEGVMVLVDARDTLYTYSILTCLTNFSNPVWTWKSILFIGVPFMMSNLLQSFKFVLDSSLSAVLLTTFTSLGFFSFAVYVWRWIQHVANMKVDDISSTNTILCSAYVLFFGIFLLGRWIVSYIPSREGDPWSSEMGVAYYTLYELPLDIDILWDLLTKLLNEEPNLKDTEKVIDRVPSGCVSLIQGPIHYYHLHTRSIPLF